MTATVSSPFFISIDGGPMRRTDIPHDVYEALEHVRTVMVKDTPSGSPEAIAVEWAEVWDTVSRLIDPDFEERWEVY